ncbi:hypothetical protein [Bacillus altitudinis]|uniref:hypothetical protein n=1 Tax=Bacillus altitudinis TaxID=293387 RepID=UPI000932D69A|nr:hypothetical protein [Bacillus altitudinis]OJT56800.1 hypothetical protein BFP48_13475 [Bacillus altitudinis]
MGKVSVLNSQLIQYHAYIHRQFSMEDKIAGDVGRMIPPLGKLRLNLLENQLKLKNTFTVEGYHEMKQS